MAYHRIGDSIYSDAELRAYNESTMNKLVPAIVTAVGVYWLHSWLSPMAFFMVHTTTAKVIYIIVGMVLFGLGYHFRKLIVTLAVLLVAGAIFFASCAAVWQLLGA